ncbi:type II toxin-antitoxin system RelE/ParE family toxin [candidate division WOR-3 bacterium]|jgi:mRNA interferase RelE/StbE|nr:type II toxin-antitoxin system RelE/ParE family toxin [candidate division WOR-3 bacterium]
MNYSLLILRRAQKELSDLPIDVYEKVKQTILKLSKNPRPYGCKKLKGRDGWRIRVGNYRIIYEINDKDKSIIIFHIGHRKDIYK